MQNTYPKARWRPLSSIQTEPSIGIPRLLIWHTMVGYLRSTETMFKQGGYSGVESTFGLGGSWDGDSLDGVFYEWQSLVRQADAQMAGNAFANSIECSDGGNATRAFTPKQVAASIELGVFWCKETGRPPVRTRTWNGVGFGYHRMFPEWTGGPRDCPGNARANQLEREIWPEIAHQLHSPGPVTPPTPGVAPKFPLPEGEYYGLQHYAGMGGAEEGLRLWQRQMVARGWSLSVNGQFDENCAKIVRQFQDEKGLGVDGRIGLQTWIAAWHSVVT